MFDTKCHDLASVFMADNREAFPADKYDALVNALAQEIQDTIEGYIEFPDLSLKFLAEAEERAARNCTRCGIEHDDPRAAQACAAVDSPSPYHTFQREKAGAL